MNLYKRVLNIVRLVLASLVAMGIYGQTNSLSLASASLTSTQVSMTVNLQTSGTSTVSALGWSISDPGAAILSLTVQPGSSLASASKTVLCNRAGSFYRCIASGLNAGTIPAGIVATITATYAQNAQGVPFGMVSADSSDPTGTTLAITPGGQVSWGMFVRSAQCPVSVNAPGKILCSFNLSIATIASLQVQLSSSSASLTVAATVSVPAGLSALGFVASAAAVTSSQVVTISVKAGNSVNVLVTVQAPLAPSSLQCGSSLLASGSSTNCTLGLTRAVSGTPANIALSSSSSALIVPSSISIPSGSSSGTFAAAATTVTTSTPATIKASLNAVSASTTLNVVPPSALYNTFYLTGTPSDVSGTANGSIVTPAVGPSNFQGALTLRGAGTIEFNPMEDGTGITFKAGGQQNSDTAFYNFQGPAIHNILSADEGEIDFNLQSNQSFAQRAAHSADRVVFDVYDATSEQFHFRVKAGTVLVFAYRTGGTVDQAYVIPSGTEDQLFGQGEVVNVRLLWNGQSSQLYLNGVLAQSVPYTKAQANWTAASSLTVGAADTHLNGGGLFACDDALSGLIFRGPFAPQ